jgi:Icc-related predicted phosphoesterase
MFITDIHGNIGALRRAVECAKQIMSPQFLVIGGDIAPNLVTIRFSDGEFVLRHEEMYRQEIGEDLRSRIREWRSYSIDDEHGKRSVTHVVDLDTKTFLELSDNETRLLLKDVSGFDFLCQQQIKFVTTELSPLLRSYRMDDIELFVMLGNDDFVELEELLKQEEQLGTLLYIHGRVIPLGKTHVLGYSCVPSKPFRYRYWERSEEQIHQELDNLLASHNTSNMLLSIHTPPYGTNLDMIYPSDGHVGSSAVRDLLEMKQFGIGLFGHVHESHYYSGSRHDTLGGKVVINPGGYHDSECCAVVFDSANPDNWMGLW